MQADEVEEPARSSPLGKILAIGGGLLLLLLVWYLLMGQSRSNERLTSISQTAADTVAVEPETGPQAEQQELPAAATPETVRVAPIIPPAAATDSVANESGSTTEQTQAQEPSNTPAASDTAPKTAESADEATSRVRDVLTAYYADIQAAPFSADQYFAPQVELFVILRNTTPAAISAWLEQNRFPEVKDAQIQVEPGTLRVSPPTSDGSRVATYIERGRAFRQSLQKNQYLRAQMRLRVNADYKITYQKQERLLENVLSDATAQ
jgi:type IV secretory pathway VirB10-like protein